MPAKTFIGKIAHQHGENVTTMAFLVVAEDRALAQSVMDRLAQGFSCEPEEAEWTDRGWRAPGSDTTYAAHSPRPISQFTYLELRDTLPVRCQEGLTPASCDDNELLQAAQDVVDYSDAEGCTDDLTVTSASAVMRLAEAIKRLPIRE